MRKEKTRSLAFVLSCVWLFPEDTKAQQAAEPAPPAAGAQQGDLPEVQVIQKKAPASPKAAAQKPAPAAKKSAPPAAEPAAVPSDNLDTATSAGNPIYGAARSGGAAARAENGSTPPVNPTSILPGNLEGFSSAGSRVDSSQLDQFEPRSTNDALVRVPGVNIVNDDGFARHGGIGLRGSPPRRGRKVLHLEDGQPINMSVWIDPSVALRAAARPRGQHRGAARHRDHTRSAQQPWRRQLPQPFAIRAQRDRDRRIHRLHGDGLARGRGER